MGHRHIYCTSLMPEVSHDQLWNNQHRVPQRHLEDGSFLLPSENVSASGVNATIYSSIVMRLNGRPSTSLSVDTPNYGAISSAITNDPYLHLPSSSSSNQISLCYGQYGPSSYSRLTSGEVSSTYNLQVDNGRLPFKRKIPPPSMVLGSGSASGYYGGGSSYNLPNSSGHLQPKPLSNPQYLPWDPIGMTQDRRNNTLLTCGEGSERNVRSRHSHALHMDINTPGNHMSSNLPPHYHPVANLPSPSVAGQWNNTHESMASERRMASDRRILSSGVINQSLGGSSHTTRTTMEIDTGYNSNVISSRNVVNALPAIGGPSTRGVAFDCSSYGQRTTPYRARPSYAPVGLAGTVFNGRRSELEVVESSRHSRSLPSRSRSFGRNGQMRNSYGYQSFSNEDIAHTRWVSQGAGMMDRSMYYDSRNAFDEYHDMRLDIDNMSYEELLALEERIGNVSTGLSEDTVSSCLLETMHCSYHIQDDQEEGNCVICLEEYKDRERLGRLKCGHDFHFNCIKKWLQIKNVCPICKASVSADASKEKWK